MLKTLFFILMLVGFVSAQTPSQPDTWKPLKFFIGAWEGIGKGEPGESKLEREYKLILIRQST